MATSEPVGEDLRLPRPFFIDVVAATRDLAELKAVLYVLATEQQDGTPGVELSSLLQPDILRAIAPDVSPEPAESRVRLALERAVVNGALLQIRTRGRAGRSVRYLPNTAENRRLIDALRDGDVAASSALKVESGDTVEIYRPNAFAVYERWIGPLTPLVAEKLRDAERSYPREWIESALQIAAATGHHSWRYAEAILDRWEAEGGPPSHPA
jgi:DnaD/phage-associated family protein